MTYLEVKQLLENNTCVVNFTKRDGTVAEFTGTLIPSNLPVSQQVDPWKFFVRPLANTDPKDTVDETKIGAWSNQDSKWYFFEIDKINSITPE